jgi:ABC-type transporter Mla MlaB component
LAAPEESPAISMPALPSAPDPTALVMAFDDPIDCAGIPVLCERLRMLLERSTVDVVDCDVRAVDRADVTVIDALARLALTAQRLGGRLRLVHASSNLSDLLVFAGLDEVVGLGRRLPLEPEGQVEEGE